MHVGLPNVAGRKQRNAIERVRKLEEREESKNGNGKNKENALYYNEDQQHGGTEERNRETRKERQMLTTATNCEFSG